VAAGQNGLVNVVLVITMVRIQTVGQGEQAEKQRIRLIKDGHLPKQKGKET